MASGAVQGLVTISAPRGAAPTMARLEEPTLACAILVQAERPNRSLRDSAGVVANAFFAGAKQAGAR